VALFARANADGSGANDRRTTERPGGAATQPRPTPGKPLPTPGNREELSSDALASLLFLGRARGRLDLDRRERDLAERDREQLRGDLPTDGLVGHRYDPKSVLTNASHTPPG
jgi:hypothetical protein